MKLKLLILVAVLLLVGYALSKHSVHASSTVKVYRVEATDGSGNQEFIPLGGMRTTRRALEASDIVGFSCTSDKDGDKCFVLAK